MKASYCVNRDESGDWKIKEQLNQQSHPELEIIHSHKSFPAFAAKIKASLPSRTFLKHERNYDDRDKEGQVVEKKDNLEFLKQEEGSWFVASKLKVLTQCLLLF